MFSCYAISTRSTKTDSFNTLGSYGSSCDGPCIKKRLTHYHLQTYKCSRISCKTSILVYLTHYQQLENLPHFLLTPHITNNVYVTYFTHLSAFLQCLTLIGIIVDTYSIATSPNMLVQSHKILNT